MSPDLDENLSEMDRMLLGEIAVPVKANGKGKTLDDTGYDTDVVDGAHVLAAIKEMDKKFDKGGKLHEDENTELLDAKSLLTDFCWATDDDETHKAAMALMSLSPQKRRSSTPKARVEYPVKKHAPSHAKKASKSGKDKAVVAEPATPTGKTTRLSSKSGAVNDKTNTNIASKKSGPSTKPTSPGKTASPAKSTGSKSSGSSSMTARETPRQRQAPKGAPADPRPVPSSWDDADDADKMLMTMKQAGKTWEEIREAWEKKTGFMTQPSSLPNRYTRIKCNMTRLKKGDDALLMVAKEQVEKQFSHEKWSLIASYMKNHFLTDDYPTAFLQKEAKKCQTTLDKGHGKKLAAAIAKAKLGGVGSKDDEEE